MDSIDLDIIKFISTRENYEAYKDVIDKTLCTQESWTLVEDIGHYYNDYPTVNEIDLNFSLWMRVHRHPGWKPEQHTIYERIVSNSLERDDPKSTVFMGELNRLRSVSTIHSKMKELEGGTITLDEFMTGLPKVGPASTEDTLTDFTLEKLADYQRDNKGYYWRCEDLNKSIGPIRKGDVVIIAKRPEVGGTSFLVSEMSYMMEQMDAEGKGIIFNNEEAPDKVYSRMVTASLGLDYRTLLSDATRYQSDYDTWLGDRTWHLEHDTASTIGKIHNRLRSNDYGIIGINVLLKVGGTRAKEDHDKFQALGEELRRIAQQHGPVLAIVQADPSAEGMRYIPQDRIYKSKTALQGEADALIMIGKDEEDKADVKRHIYVAKNKIPPAKCCDLTAKHIKTEVNFDIATGRFTSSNFKGNSRHA